MPPAVSGWPLALASAARSRRSSASARRPATEPTLPITAAPAVISAPGVQRAASPSTGTTRLRTVRAMLHAAHHLLADEAALGEGHAVELVEVGLVREGIAERIVLAAFRHAERDAVRVVVLGCGIARRCVAEAMSAANSAQPECAVPSAGRRGSANAHRPGRLARALRSVAPQREHAIVRAGILDRRPWRAACTCRAAWPGRPPCRAPVSSRTARRRLLTTKKSNRILPCGVSKRGVDGRLRSQQVHVVGDDALQQLLGVLAGDAHDAAVGKQRDLGLHHGDVPPRPHLAKRRDLLYSRANR